MKCAITSLQFAFYALHAASCILDMLKFLAAPKPTVTSASATSVDCLAIRCRD